MGTIRPLFVKRIARKVVERYGDLLKGEFEHDKKVVEQVLDIPSKRLRNLIAGYVVRLYRRYASS